MPYLKKVVDDGRSKVANPHWYVRVPTRNGGAVQMSTRTREKKTAKRIETMLLQFVSGKKREYFDLIDAVHEGRLRLLDLLEADDNNNLTGLRAKLLPPAPAPPPEPSITGQIDRWQRWLRDSVSLDTASHYLAAVLHFVAAYAERAKSLTPAGEPKADGAGVRPVKRSRKALMQLFCPASQLTSSALYGWLTDLEVGASTKRKYHAAMRSFIDHLIRVEMLTGENPMDKVPMPPAADPRTHYLETYEALRLVLAFTDPEYRAFNALMAGSGIEVSAALSVRKRDVYPDVREVRAPGTKTYNRDRIVRVAEWAWPYVEQRLEGLGPDDKLFPGIQDRWVARDVFVATIFPLALEFPCYRGYTMRDHRHTYAVRAARAGTPPQLIAAQLGHVDAVLVLKVYGKFLPKSDERDRWERKAAELDAKAGIEVGTPDGALPVDVTHGTETRMTEESRRAKIQWPSVEHLLDLLSRASTQAVAKSLGVSDVALRKHLKARGVDELPDGRRRGASRPRSTSRDDNVAA